MKTLKTQKKSFRFDPNHLSLLLKIHPGACPIIFFFSAIGTPNYLNDHLSQSASLKEYTNFILKIN
jgi:hypothetical protein